MTALIISQIVVALIFIGGLEQSILFKKQNKKNWWLGIIVALIALVGTVLIWIVK